MKKAHGALTLLIAGATSAAVLCGSVSALAQRADDADTYWRAVFGESAGFEAHRDRVFDEWRERGSYYALLEIVEGRIEPALGKIRRESVVALLGEKRLDLDYPNSRRDNFLVWSSQRLVPHGSRLVVSFDADGVAQSVAWVSE